MRSSLINLGLFLRSQGSLIELKEKGLVFMSCFQELYFTPELTGNFCCLCVLFVRIRCVLCLDPVF